jgi:hypothetical protein
MTMIDQPKREFFDETADEMTSNVCFQFFANITRLICYIPSHSL